MRRSVTSSENAGHVPARFPDFDHITRLNRIGGDIDLAAIDVEVSMAHELTGLGSAGRQTHAVKSIVKPTLEHAEHQFAGDTFLSNRLLVKIPKLSFKNAIVATSFLLFAQLKTVADDLGLFDLFRAVRERNCASRSRTFLCGTARPSGITSCPRDGKAGKQGQYNVPINNLQ